MKIDGNTTTGYGLSGDARQLDSIPNATDGQERDAVMRVCRRYRGEEAWEVLGMLGLTKAAEAMLRPPSAA